MLALIERRRQAHVDTGGRIGDDEAARKQKEVETNFVAGLITEIQAFPRLGDVKDSKEIARLICKCIPVGQYDDLLNKMISAEGISEQLGKV